jgi:hydroxylysine kinase
VAAVIRITPAQAESIARRHYGAGGRAQRLASEHDDAFRIVAGDGSSRLLKIGQPEPGAGSAPELPSFQASVLLHLAETAPELPVQRVVTTLDGAPEVLLPASSGPARLARMTSWLDGSLLGRCAATPELRRETGGTLARLNRALRGFSHPGARRTHQWDLQNFGRLRELLGELPDSGLLPEVERRLGAEGAGQNGARHGAGLGAELAGCLDHFARSVQPRLAGVPVQVIHTDFHGENLLTDGTRVTGILDFGDALTGPVAMDVGVAACYQLGSVLNSAGPDAAAILAPAGDVVAGYRAVEPLTDADLVLAAEFIVARVAARIIVSQWNAVREPANQPYLLRRTPQAVGHFLAMARLGADDIARFLAG